MSLDYSINKLSRVLMLILALAPILAWYDIQFPVGLGYMLILFLSAFMIARNKFRVSVMPKVFWLVFVYVCMMWAYNNHFTLKSFFPPGGWLFFMFALAVVGGTISFSQKYLKKYMRIVLFVAIALFWVQFILMITTGSQRYCFVPPLTNSFTYEGLTYGDLVAMHLSSNYPCSIFLEKSYMAYYSMAYLALEWFETEAKHRIFTKEIMLILITLLVLRSGSGMVGGTILFAVKMFSMFWNSGIRRRIIMVLLLIPLIVGSFFVYQSTEAGQAMLSRSSELSTENTSGYTRIVAGYMLFDSMTPNEKMIGIPDFRSKFGIETTNGKVVLHINGVQTILISLGYIGAIVYLIFYISLFRKVSLQSRMSIIMLLTMGLLESNYLNAYMMLFTIIPCGEYYLNNKKRLTI